MQNKIVKIILIALAVMVLCGLTLGTVAGWTRAAGDRRRADRLATRAIAVEEKLAETDKLYSEALETIGRSGVELDNLRASNRRLEEIAREFDAENQRLRATIDELEDLGGELAGGLDDAQQLARAIDGEARTAFAIMERIQKGIAESD